MEWACNWEDLSIQFNSPMLGESDNRMVYVIGFTVGKAKPSESTQSLSKTERTNIPISRAGAPMLCCMWCRCVTLVSCHWGSSWLKHGWLQISANGVTIDSQMRNESRNWRYEVYIIYSITYKNQIYISYHSISCISYHIMSYYTIWCYINLRSEEHTSWTPVT